MNSRLHALSVEFGLLMPWSGLPYPTTALFYKAEQGDMKIGEMIRPHCEHCPVCQRIFSQLETFDREHPGVHPRARPSVSAQSRAERSWNKVLQKSGKSLPQEGDWFLLPVPQLAEVVELSESRFRLRKGIAEDKVFHDEREIGCGYRMVLRSQSGMISFQYTTSFPTTGEGFLVLYTPCGTNFDHEIINIAVTTPLEPRKDRKVREATGVFEFPLSLCRPPFSAFTALAIFTPRAADKTSDVKREYVVAEDGVVMEMGVVEKNIDIMLSTERRCYFGIPLTVTLSFPNAQKGNRAYDTGPYVSPPFLLEPYGNTLRRNLQLPLPVGVKTLPAKALITLKLAT